MAPDLCPMVLQSWLLVRTCNLLLTNTTWQRWRDFEDVIKAALVRFELIKEVILNGLTKLGEAFKREQSIRDADACWPGGRSKTAIL